MTRTQTIFMVTHTHEINPGEEDDKLIGVYSNREKADLAVDRAKTLPGFRDHPEGFLVEPYGLDEDHWREGFVTVYGTQKRAPVPVNAKLKLRRKAKKKTVPKQTRKRR